MTIGTSDGQQYADQFQHAVAVGEPVYHPPEWRGNKWYGTELRDAGESDKIPSMQTNDSFKQDDMDKSSLTPSQMNRPTPAERNPYAVPDLTGTGGRGGWNRVSTNDNKFVPINPMTPAYNNPGGHEHIAPIENPGRAVSVHKSTKESPESIYSAAIKTNDGVVHMGINHSEAYMNALESKHMKPNEYLSDEAQGFVTTKGRFVSRHEAKDIANASKQVHIDYESKHGLLSEELDPDRVENIQKLLIEYLGEKPKK